MLGPLLRAVWVVMHRLACGWLLAAASCRAQPAVVEPPTIAASETPAGPVLAVPAVEPSDWFEAELVLALGQSEPFSRFEDEHHPRVMVFADGNVLYRRRGDDGWEWYRSRRTPDQAEAMRSQVVADLENTPERFSCLQATHRMTTSLVVHDGGHWRVHEGYALSACMSDVPPNRPLASTAPAVQPPADPVPPGFAAAFRRLRDYSDPDATRWITPRVRLSLHAARERGEPAEPWPESIPQPRDRIVGDQHSYPLEAKYGEALRTLGPGWIRWQHAGEPWFVDVVREHPGDVAYEAALSSAFADREAAGDLECRARLRAVGACIDANASLDTRADELCRELAEAAETAPHCGSLLLHQDVCVHAIENGCEAAIEG